MGRDSMFKEIVKWIVVLVVVALAIYGLIQLIGNFSDVVNLPIKTNNPEVTSGPDVSVKPTNTIKPTLAPTPTPEPTPEPVHDISIELEADKLIITNAPKEYDFRYQTGKNRLLFFMPNSNCSELGIKNAKDSKLIDSYAVSEKENGIVIDMSFENFTTFKEKKEGDDLVLSLIPLKNKRDIWYRNDLSRVYMIINQARLCSEIDSFDENYIQDYDEKTNTYTLKISKKKMPNLVDEKIMLNDGTLKSFEFKNVGDEVHMIFKTYEKIIIYPNTRHYEASFTFIAPRKSDKTLIVVDPGHGGIDGGTTSQDKKVLEKNIVINMAKYLTQNLIEAGFDVINLREEDIYLGLKERTDIANLYNAAAIISVHANSFTKSSSNGAETMYKTSFDLANSIQKNLISETGAGNRGAIFYDNMSILNGAEMESVIVETGFLTNPKELKLLVTDEYQKKVAKGIANGVIEFFANK